MIPEMPLDPPEPRICHYCHNCDSEIYEGDTCYRIDGVYYCDSCIEDFKEEAELESWGDEDD